jgi:hypothetical protein
MCTGTRGCCKQASWCALQTADPASPLLGQPEGVTLRLVDCGGVRYWSDGNSLRHHFPSGMSAKDTIVANSNREDKPLRKSSWGRGLGVTERRRSEIDHRRSRGNNRITISSSFFRCSYPLPRSWHSGRRGRLAPGWQPESPRRPDR